MNNSKFSFALSLAAGSAPVISVSPSSLTITEGEEAMFECKAAGNPPPTVRWSRANGQILESSWAVSGVLRILSTTPEDEGVYACTAANSFGAKAFLVTLDVKIGGIYQNAKSIRKVCILLSERKRDLVYLLDGTSNS